MNRSRGSRGYRGLGPWLTHPHNRVSERRGNKAGCKSGTGVLAGRKHKRTASSHRRMLGGSHTRQDTSQYHTTHDIPYIHSQHNTKGIHKPHNISRKRRGAAAFNTVSTHTPYIIPFTRTHYLRPTHAHTNARLTTYTQPSQHPLWIPMHGFLVAGIGIEQADESLGLIPPRVQGQLHIHKPHHRHTRTHSKQAVSVGFAFTNPSQDIHTTCTDTFRVDTHSHPHYKRKGTAKAQHSRYTHIHTRHTVSKGFTFAHPGQDTHKQIGYNIPQEPMRFIGQCNKPRQRSSTGVMHTNRPWFRRILAIGEEGRAGARVEHSCYRQGAQVAEDRHKGWTHTGMIPNETPKVKKYKDFLPLHDWLLQHLGGRQRFILYRINMNSSPHPRCDLERNNWFIENCPGEINRWEKAIYRILEQAFQNFKPTQYIFHQHRIEHPLGASRVWLSLLEKFQQLEAGITRKQHQTMGKEYQDDARSDAENENDCTYIHARGIQLEQVSPVHFIKSSMSPAHLHMRLSWRNMVCHAHASKMLLSKRWKYLLKRRSHRRRMDVRLRPCREDMSPSHRSPLDRYADTPPTRWTRKPREAGVIYGNETTIEETPFIIPLKSFRVHSLQESEIRVVVRYDRYHC